MVVMRCLTTEEAVQAINWKVIFLLAGILPLGIALEKTGAAKQLAGFLLGGFENGSPTIALAGLFFLSMMLTNVMSNQATAIILAPIAIQIAQSLSVSPKPLLMALSFAASLSFMTPIGYQTNTMIYSVGEYRFTDFTRVGTPLNLILWLLATLLIPIFWPFATA